MANLSLADAVDAAEALFESIRIPWQIVIDHQMGAALKIPPPPCGVVRDHYANDRIRIERSDGRASSFASNATMNYNNRCRLPYPCCDLLLQIFQSIFRLSEDDDLPPEARC